MKKKWVSAILISMLVAQVVHAQTFKLTKEELKNKIKGGWAGQTIACTFGAPTEFKYLGTLIQDYVPIPWYDGYLKFYYENIPGLYDDVYMDLTFVEVFEKRALMLQPVPSPKPLPMQAIPCGMRTRLPGIIFCAGSCRRNLETGSIILMPMILITRSKPIFPD